MCGCCGDPGFSLWYKRRRGVEEGKNKPCESFIAERVKRQRYPAVVSTSSDQINFS